MMNIAILMSLSMITLQANAVCIHNTRCHEPRGVIQQSESDVSFTEKVITRHRWWNIHPEESRGVILLVFKNFQTTGSEVAKVRIFKRSGEEETRIFSGKMGNFELLSANVENVLVNITLALGQNTSFTLNYYGDCEIAQENPIAYPDQTMDQRYQATCFIIAPSVHGYINRIYYTVRNIVLPEEVQLRLLDVHSSEVITVIDNKQEYISVAVESTATTGGINSYFALVDLTCSTGPCDYSGVEYLASYYAMNEEDIWCIEVQKLCAISIDDVPREWCEMSCPGLEAMSEQEYILESDYQTTRVGSIDEAEDDSNRGLKKSKVGCPNWASFPSWRCDCKRHPRTDIFYCHSRVKCHAQKGCTWRCILTKILRCFTVKRVVSVTLL